MRGADDAAEFAEVEAVLAGAPPDGAAGVDVPEAEAAVPAAADAEADAPVNRLCAGGTGCNPNPGVRIGVR